jgi:hypothetical protein
MGEDMALLVGMPVSALLSMGLEGQGKANLPPPC